VNGPNITAHEVDFGAGNAREITRSENPGRLLVRPRLRITRVLRYMVAENPLIGSGSHGECADVADERRVAGICDVAKWEEPVERVVRIRVENIERRGGVVLGLNVANATPAAGFTSITGPKLFMFRKVWL
jgi:hypothetical protein